MYRLSLNYTWLCQNVLRMHEMENFSANSLNKLKFHGDMYQFCNFLHMLVMEWLKTWENFTLE
ncbi:hypothetical protein T4B_4376 [Trichinella pseudospiralis]|uniref:Uncharacterized protein n=1 Tax=Trichinella pseudospiralis TaxID=6337 RepID=A0A0V1KFN1_TRIPS|nr:hypothetical protein T4B_4376 [Trichinella pseudospiralis]KRZ45990.1 hypothetical protein T4C_9879 [Trichinella pseudospiralis]